MRLRLRLLPVYGLTFLVETVLWVFRFIVPLRLLQLGASPFEVGVVMGTYAFTIAASALLLGLVSDRLGRKNMVLFGLIIVTTAGLAAASVGTVIELLVTYSLLGIGFASLSPSLDASVADNAQSSHIGRAFGVQTASIHMGSSLGPALAGFTAASLGLVTSMYSAVAISATGFAMLPYAFRVIRGRDRDTGKPKLQISRLPTNRGLILGWTGFFTSFCLWSGVSAFLPIYGKVVGLEVGEIGSIFALQAALAFVSRIPLGVLVDRVRREPGLVVIGLAATALAVFFVGYVSSYLLLLLLILIVAAGRSVANLGSHVLVARSAEQNTRGMAMSTASASRNLGGSVGPIIIGSILGSQGYQGSFSALAIASFLGLCGVVIVTRTMGSRKREQATN